MVLCQKPEMDCPLQVGRELLPQAREFKYDFQQQQTPRWFQKEEQLQ